MAETKKNYYEILGVSKNATQDEIKSAYRKLVKQYHPDLHPNDETAAAKFKEVNAANEVLSDEQKRAAYDYELEHPGAANFGGFEGFSGGFGGSGFSGFSDIFSDFFSGFSGGGSSAEAYEKERGSDITMELELSFLDAAKGCPKEVTYSRRIRCSACKGTGAKDGTAYSTCEKCGGTGRVKVVSGGGLFRSVSVRPCPDCGGSGKKIHDKCPDCGGRGYVMTRNNTTVKFDIPAGADTNSYIRKKGYGHASTQGGEPGDLIVVFKVLPHRIFKRNQYDLYVDLPVSFSVLALGGKVQIPTLDSVTELDIPAGTQPGKKFIVRGKGIRSRMGSGNLYVTVNVEVPTGLSRAQKKSIEDFEAGSDLRQSVKMKEYDDAMESLYNVRPYSKK